MATSRLRGGPPKWEQELREFSLAFPETREDFPWGERVIKVRSKVFIFMGCNREALSLSVKLPVTHGAALTLPFTEPTGYGLGRHGWVSARFAATEKPPMELLFEWIGESYRAVAPKTLVKQLDGAPQGQRRPPSKRNPAKKRGRDR